MSTGMACDFHDYHEKGSCCSLSKVKTWAYTILRDCKSRMQVEHLEGHHRPVEMSPFDGKVSHADVSVLKSFQSLEKSLEKPAPMHQHLFDDRYLR